ncbi:hypothetical protein [uncultured Tenacibaculum sp.]|uniref:hypothetical protein n=1 Tax=uncultured Tenacibaculum sp. TaxID=174713 RepID=UPI00263690B6|nr:hypothetical protein [uncultured Tenacibaculum sp.]
MSNYKKLKEGYFDTTSSTSLEDKMTSLRAVSIAVLFYILGYAVKLSVLFSDVLEGIIGSTYIRFSASFFTSLAIATGLLIVSVNGHKKATPYIIAIMDSITLLLVFKVFDSIRLTDVFTTSFLSVFMAFIGYQLITVFVVKYKEEVSESKQSLSGLKQELNDLEQRRSEAERKLKEIEATTCEKCNRVFTSQNGLNAHKCK